MNRVAGPSRAGNQAVVRARRIRAWCRILDWNRAEFYPVVYSYRTKKSPRLQTSVAHAYDAPGAYTIIVKVIDILGNDTTRSIPVDVK